jgi:hypothetical protein
LLYCNKQTDKTFKLSLSDRNADELLDLQHMLLDKKLCSVGKEKDGGVACKFETEPEAEGTSAVLNEGDL